MESSNYPSNPPNNSRPLNVAIFHPEMEFFHHVVSAYAIAFPVIIFPLLCFIKIVKNVELKPILAMFLFLQEIMFNKAILASWNEKVASKFISWQDHNKFTKYYF